MPAPTIQFKRGSFANVGLASFRSGEPGFTTDKYDFYVGLDGTAANQKFFGSARYWTREAASSAATLNLYGQTNSNNYVSLRSPASPVGIVTYTLPDTITANNFLTVNASGQLSWASVTASASLSNATFTGITTFSSGAGNLVDIGANAQLSGIVSFTNTADNTLGTTNTGAVQISGGAAVTKNLTVGSGLSVTGNSTIGGNLAVNGGTVTTTGTAATVFNTNATTVNAFGAATVISIGANTGITTINNSLRITNFLRDSSNNAGSSGQFLTVTGAGIGWTTIGGVSGSGVSTATRATTVDSTSTSDAGTYFPALFSSSTSANGAIAYVDAGISFDASANSLTLGGNLAVNGGTVTTTGTAATVFNTNATTVNAFGAATAISIGAATGTATVNNTTVTLANATALNINGTNPTVASSSTGTLSLFNTNLTAVNAFGAANNLIIGANNTSTGVTTVRTKLTVAGALEVDGNSIQSSAGTTVLTLNNQDASFANNVTVAGNLTVNGTTTQVNTSELQVYDRTITLGIQSGTTPTNTTWDLGILMNYGNAGVANTAGVIWEAANRRFQFATNSDNPVGINTATPQITVATFAPIEVSALWINDAAGQNQVISYLAADVLFTGSSAGRYLHNVTVDAGIF